MLYVTSARLLLLGAGWCVRNIITLATVSSQCCGANCVLGEEFGPHNATTIRYDTIEEINVDSKAEYTA